MAEAPHIEQGLLVAHGQGIVPEFHTQGKILHKMLQVFCEQAIGKQVFVSHIMGQILLKQDPQHHVFFVFGIEKICFGAVST